MSHYTVRYNNYYYTIVITCCCLILLQFLPAPVGIINNIIAMHVVNTFDLMHALKTHKA